MLQLVHSRFHDFLTCDKIPTTRTPYARDLAACLSLSIKFYFQTPPNLIAALHSTSDVAVSYILLLLRRQVPRHSESFCTTVHTSLRSICTSHKVCMRSELSLWCWQVHENMLMSVLLHCIVANLCFVGVNHVEHKYRSSTSSANTECIYSTFIFVKRN